MHRKHTVIIDWIDGDVEDSDEIVVFADSADEAARKARAKWRMTIGAKWPNCRIAAVSIVRGAAVKKLA